MREREREGAEVEVLQRVNEHFSIMENLLKFCCSFNLNLYF